MGTRGDAPPPAPPPRDARPRLVPVDPRAVTLDDGTRAIALHDPMGIVEVGVVLSPAAFWLAAHFDGRRAVEDVVEAARAQGLAVTAAEVAGLADALREAGLVHGPVHDALHARALAAFRALAVRPPTCAGGVYPPTAAALRRALEAWLAHPDGPGPRPPRPPAPPRVVIAPHIDYARGGAGYAHAYAALAASDAELFVVFGTAHATPPHLFTLTRLDHDTPLGPVPTDRPVVDALVRALGEEELLADELCHRDEHACELQMPWLRHVLGARRFTVLPVLCSSIAHLDDPGAATAPFLDALARAVAGRRVCYVAAADLAHVGPRYGDPRPPPPERLRALAEEDRRTLAFAARGDAAGFHRDAARDDARRRICGTAPIYAALRASGARARLLHYAQWTDGVDSVSYAAAAG